jgi:AcrR family transcriptional regulator
MPRKRTVPDIDVLDAALDIVRSSGPDTLTFAALASRAGLAGSTIVQRFGTRTELLRATLLRAWDLLDEETAMAIRDAAPEPRGVIEMLVQLSGQYDARDFADQLLVLREDVRDPVLRARGEAWISTLTVAIEDRLRDAPGGADGLGRLVVAQWQGTLTVWSFTPKGPVTDAVHTALEHLLRRLGVVDGRRPSRKKAPPGARSPIRSGRTDRGS